jgi:hypothetical protein
MVLHPPDERDSSTSTEQAPVEALPPTDGVPLLIPPPPPPPPAAPDVATASEASPPARSRRRRRARTAGLVAGAMGLVVAAAVLGGLAWDLDGQVSDLTEENGALTAENASLGGRVSELTGEQESLRGLFPITQESMAGADLEGTYEFLFVPVEGQCTYSDCDQIGPSRYALSISRAPDGYALGIVGLPGPQAPMSREGTVYSTSGVLPESMWSVCGDTPGETSFEMHLTVAAVGLAGTNLRAIEASGTYRQYVPATLDCAPSESTSTFTARRTG